MNGPERPWWRDRRIVGWALLIAAAAMLLGGLIAGGYFLTIHTAQVQARHTATAIEQERAAVLAKAQAVALKGELQECEALKGLADVSGSHGTSGATYGANLETGIRNVYEKSGCPGLLSKYGSHP